MRRYFPHFRVGRQRYGPNSLGTLVEPQQKVFAVPPISVDGDLYDIHPMRRGSVKSFVDDLVLGRGVVISRAATSLRSVETQPLTRRFVRNQTNDISVPSLSRVGGSVSLLGCWRSLSPTVGLGRPARGRTRASWVSGLRLETGCLCWCRTPLARSLLSSSGPRHSRWCFGAWLVSVSRPSLGVRGTQVRLLPRAFILHVRFAAFTCRLISEKLGTLARDPRRRPLPTAAHSTRERASLAASPGVCVCLSLSQVSLHAPRPTSLWSRSLVSLPSDSGFLWPVSKTINVPGVSFGFTQSPKSSVCLRPL